MSKSTGQDEWGLDCRARSEEDVLHSGSRRGMDVIGTGVIVFILALVFNGAQGIRVWTPGRDGEKMVSALAPVNNPLRN